MSTQHRLTSQIVQSAQVWVCDTCGGQDHKSCGCNSTARMEELAAKREANRQASRRAYEKAKQNQRPSNDEADVEIVDEIESGPEDDDQTIWRRGLVYRAKQAAGHAAFEDWSQFAIDSELIRVV